MHVRAATALSFLLSAPIAFALPLPSAGVPSEPAQFQVSEQTEVPNTTLKPGAYSIRVVDHLKDRMIVEIQGRNNVHTTFIAIPAGTMATAGTGPIPYSAGPKGKSALKGFSFPGGTTVEFVYPKNNAVSLAKANGTRVMAIDPASEGRVPASKLTSNDMQMISLWMLEPTPVTPNSNQVGIAASHYQAPTTQVASSAAPADTTVAAPPVSADNVETSPVPNAPARVHHSKPSAQPSVQVASADVPPPPRTRSRANVTTLPHTASSLPLAELLSAGFFALGGALSLRRLRARG